VPATGRELVAFNSSISNVPADSRCTFSEMALIRLSFEKELIAEFARSQANSVNSSSIGKFLSSLISMNIVSTFCLNDHMTLLVRSLSGRPIGNPVRPFCQFSSSATPSIRHSSYTAMSAADFESIWWSLLADCLDSCPNPDYNTLRAFAIEEGLIAASSDPALPGHVGPDLPAAAGYRWRVANVITQVIKPAFVEKRILIDSIETRFSQLQTMMSDLLASNRELLQRFKRAWDMPRSMKSASNRKKDSVLMVHSERFRMAKRMAKRMVHSHGQTHGLDRRRQVRKLYNHLRWGRSCSLHREKSPS
jgi:hypothetical protein